MCAAVPGRRGFLLPIARHLLVRGAFMLGLASLLSPAIAPEAMAQAIQTDGSTGTTVMTGNNLDFTITAGTLSGTNLFHSFSSFSVLTNGSAVFDPVNTPGTVTNIIGRVTGTTPSTIDGRIRAIGGASGANLFLLNPNGIVLSPNAQLQIGGSFVASTAERLTFADGTQFISSDATPNPLLTVSAPTGLQLGATSGAIQVREDAGYNTLATQPVLSLDSSSSLRVNPGQMLALVGSDITLTRGALAAPGGQIELGGVRQGTVGLTLGGGALTHGLDYTNVQTFGDVQLGTRSLLNASSVLNGATGTPIAFAPQAGSIQIQGRRISFQDGSRALIQHFENPISGTQNFGNIRLGASEIITLTEQVINNGRDPGVATMNFGTGTGGNITVSTPQLQLSGDAAIGTDTYGTGSGGNVRVDAEQVRILNSPQTPNDSSLIDTASYGPGVAGNVTVSAQQINIERGGITSQAIGTGPGGTVTVNATDVVITKGGSIASAALGAGTGGNVQVNARTVTAIGIAPFSFFPSTITSASVNTGTAGNVTINTQQLRLQNGGRVDSSALAFGDGGTVTVNATDSIVVSGTVPNSINPSAITSAANILDPALRAFFAGLGIIVPAVPTGDSGDVVLNTPSLSVTDGAEVTVKNDGPSNAGTLSINANSVYLNQNAGITASTQQGSGGNLTFNIQESLLLRRGSRISATAGGAGNGGNINLTVPVLVALENSDIIANAVQGTGGNIAINTQGILGTAFREQLTPESDITASSEFGLSGVVEISNLEVDPSSAVVELPENLDDASGQIVAGCSATQGNQFVASGRGGLPLDPTGTVAQSRPWSDIRPVLSLGSEAEPGELALNPSSTALSNVLSPPVPTSTGPATEPMPEPILEATGWGQDNDGQVILMTQADRLSTVSATSVGCLKPAIANNTSA